jgi:DNA polymerase
MGWTRQTVYIANTTKCRPPNNRNPQPDELEQCMPFLHAQIAAIAPRIIVALGRPASNQLLGTDAPISSLRGRFHDYARVTADRVSLKIMPTFHPAYLLREPEKKRTAWADLKLVMAELARLGITAPFPARG